MTWSYSTYSQPQTRFPVGAKPTSGSRTAAESGLTEHTPRRQPQAGAGPAIAEVKYEVLLLAIDAPPASYFLIQEQPVLGVLNHPLKTCYQILSGDGTTSDDCPLVRFDGIKLQTLSRAAGHCLGWCLKRKRDVSSSYLSNLPIGHASGNVDFVREDEETSSHEPLSPRTTSISSGQWSSWFFDLPPRVASLPVPPYNRRYVDGRLRPQPKSGHPSSRSNFSNTIVGFSVRLRPLHIKTISLHRSGRV